MDSPKSRLPVGLSSADDLEQEDLVPTDGEATDPRAAGWAERRSVTGRG